MMSLAYAIAFLCLLRLDEVLNIKVEHLRWMIGDNEKVELTLSFRKTRQDGGIVSPPSPSFVRILIGYTEVPPFYLWHLPEKPWLDVPSLLASWLEVSGIDNGNIFGSFFSSDQPKLVNGQLKKIVSYL